MKLLFLLYWLSRSGGGVCPAACSLGLALKERGVSPNVVGLNDPFWQQDAHQWSSLKTRALPWSGPRAFGWSPDLGRLLNTENPDLVHVHGLWMYYSMANHAYCRKNDRPYVVSPHGMLEPWAISNNGWKKKLAGLAYENAHLRDASCLHALTETERQSFRAYGLKNPVAIIPNGVALPRLSQAPQSPRRSSQKHHMLFLGRIHPKKGLRELLDGWALWNKQQSLTAQNWLLQITGWDDGDHLKVLLNQAKEQFGNEAITLPGGQPSELTQVIFTGPRFGADKDAAFREASGFILPSFSEGLPMAVLEAWSYQVPVLITAECHLSEGFSENAALEIKPTPSSIADALQQFASLPESERHLMGMRGRKLVEDKYTWDRVAESMLAVYQWLTANASQPSNVER